MTARLRGDVKICTMKNNRQVLNFSIAIKDSYMVKAKEEPEVITYVQFDYWVNPCIAPYLTKGKLVE